MARARWTRDDRGRVCVFGSARAPDGRRLRKRIIVPENDEALAAETVRELNRRFALGDLTWFQEPAHRAPGRSAPRSPTVAEWCKRWLDEASGEIFVEATCVASGEGTTEASQASVTFTAESFAKARRLIELRAGGGAPAEIVVGWYHSHPFRYCAECPLPNSRKSRSLAIASATTSAAR